MEIVNLNESAYWLALINNSGLKLAQLKPIAQQWYLMEGRSIAQLFNLSVTEVSVRFSLTEEQAQTLLQAAKAHQTQLARLKGWQQAGIQVLTLSHPHYPKRLIYTLPPKQQPLVLWARGNTRLLAEPAITILGQTEPDSETASYVNTLMALIASESIGVVSGYGKGLDRIAFEGIIAQPEGHGIAILPMGLGKFAQLTTSLDASIAAGQTLLLSPFAPDITYQESYAEARNLIVDSLALALLVPQVDSASQTRAGAAMARGLPVLVGMNDSPENRTLIAEGAFLMTDPGEVVEMVQQAIIDEALQVQMAQTPASEGQPPHLPKEKTPSLLDEGDDYALGREVADPMQATEVHSILSAGGNIPDTLRARLMALEAEQKQDDGETD